jgi:glucose 1-dehydrogenase
MPGNTAYRLSKGGVRILTRIAGIELAPRNVLVVGSSRRGRHPN